MRCQIVIPARLASTRLSEKLLLRAAGKTVLQHTYEAAMRAETADSVVVAVDHPRLAEEVERFGGRYQMTSPDCASGTDRIAETAAAAPETEIFVNVQGDEPEIDPASIDRVARTLAEHPEASIATAATPIRDAQQLEDPGCVKVVLGSGGRALYFSRAAVPHPRGGVTSELLTADPPLFWHHIGLYAYRREFLTWFAGQGVSRLEQTERLEQLRALEAGKEIVVAAVESASPGIDTAEDFHAFARRVENR